MVFRLVLAVAAFWQPRFWSALIPAAVGAIGQIAGQSSANRTNRAIAESQEQFQERMSSTSYQRAVEDLNKAGLNPMLAYQQGGASSPAGASIPVQNEIGPAVSTAMQAAQLSAGLEKIKAETNASNAQALVATAMAPKIASEARLANVQANVAQATEMDQRTKFSNETGKSYYDYTMAQEHNFQANIESKARQLDFENQRRLNSAAAARAEQEIAFQAEAHRADMRQRAATSRLAELDIPRAENEASKAETWYGENIAPYLGDVGRVTSSASRLVPSWRKW